MQGCLETWVAIAAILVIGLLQTPTRVSQADAGVGVNVVEEADLVSEQKQQDTGKRREVPKNPVDDNGRYTGHKLEIDEKIVKAGGTTCHWNVFGTDNCVPVVACQHFNLLGPGGNKDDPCTEEYMLITDGSYGFQKYCGKDGPANVSSGWKLRDFYVTLKLAAEGKVTDRALKCSVTCSQGAPERQPLVENWELDNSEDCDCGRTPNVDRTVGVVDAARGEFPWMAALVAPGTRKPFCGGTVINNRLILTAGHCMLGSHMNAKDVNVLLNAYRLNVTVKLVLLGKARSKAIWTAEQLAEKDKQDNSYRFTVERYFFHPLYNQTASKDYDAALLKLDKPIDWKMMKEISPVCFPKGDLYGESKGVVNPVMAGWGMASMEAETTQRTLHKLEMSVFSDAKCRELFGSSVTPRMLCAGLEEGGQTACLGDSGGALIYQKSKEVWEQIGHGIFVRDTKYPTVFINSRKISQWVRYISNMEDAVWCHGN